MAILKEGNRTSKISKPLQVSIKLLIKPIYINSQYPRHRQQSTIKVIDKKMSSKFFEFQKLLKLLY